MIIYLQHITGEGTSLIQQTEEAARNQVQHLLMLFASLLFQLKKFSRLQVVLAFRTKQVSSLLLLSNI